MFYHIMIRNVIDYWCEENKTKDETVLKIVCPFIKKEVTLSDNCIFNNSSYDYMQVFKSEKPIDSDYPIEKKNFYRKILTEKEEFDVISYRNKLRKTINEEFEDVTEEIFKESIILIEEGKYKEYKEKIIDGIKSNYSFFINPTDNEEVKQNYDYVIKPTVEKYNFKIESVNEISHVKEITSIIIESIRKSRFLIADLTDEKPNCYYEVGYAHAFNKPVIILAKTGTVRHFDIQGYKWNYWTDFKNLKSFFDRELVEILKILGKL